MKPTSITDTEIWAYVSKTADEETKERIIAWKDSSSFDKQRFDVISNTYEKTAEITPGYPDLEVVKERFFAAIDSKTKEKPWLPKLWKYAAVAILLLGLSFLYLKPEKTITIATTYGEQKELELPDGTLIWLNSSSQLSYLKAKPRTLELTGEAFFEVTHDKSNPFTVTTSDGSSVQVLGTKFNVKSYSQTAYTETVLLEGSVAMSHKDVQDTILMVPKDRVRYQQLEQNLIKSTIENTNHIIAWRKGVFQFSDKTFNEIAMDLSLQRNIQIQIRNPILAESRFTGYFEASATAKEILETLQLTKTFKFNENTDGIWTVE